MAFCEIVLVGNVGKEPELRFTNSGQAVCDFSLAVNRSWTDKSTNERHEETTWFRVTVWGQQAETVNQYLKKGKQVLVVADRIEAKVYNERATLQVTARTVRFLSGGGHNNSDPIEDEALALGGHIEDDIPF